MARFHSLDVVDVRRETRDAVVVTLKPRDEDAALFDFTQGQYLTFRRKFDDDELRRSYSICAGRDEGHLQVGIKRVDGGAFSTWANEELKAGDGASRPCRRWAASSPPIEPDAAKQLPRLRRRLRHHAAALDHQDRARRRAEVDLHPGLRQPPDQLDHVPRGARGPEEPLPRPPLGHPRPRIRGAGHRPLHRPRRRREVRGAVPHLDRPRLGRHRLHLRPRADDAGDRRRAARARPRRRADQVRALRLRPARPRQDSAWSATAAATSNSTTEATVTLDGATRSFRMPKAGHEPARRRARGQHRRALRLQGRASARPAAPRCSRARSRWPSTTRSRTTRCARATCSPASASR